MVKKNANLQLSLLLLFFSCSNDFRNDMYEPVIPIYFETELSNCKKNVNNITHLSRDITSFVFITDTHWGNNEMHSPAIVRDIIENTDIDICVFGGDAIKGCYLDRNEAIMWGEKFMSSFSFLGSNMLSVVGNHDDNSNLQPESAEILSNKDIHNYLMKNMDGSVVFGSDLYYYKDVESQKTRYIGLDTGISTVSNDEWLFIINALNSCPKDWHIVVITHILLRVEMPSYTKKMSVLFDNYNNRKKGVLKSEAIEYDFSNAKAKVEICVGGHLHYDMIDKTEDGIPLLVFDRDARNSNNGLPFKKGTVDEQSITAIVADYEKDSIYCYRVGRGDDIFVKIGK